MADKLNMNRQQLHKNMNCLYNKSEMNMVKVKFQQYSPGILNITVNVNNYKLQQQAQLEFGRTRDLGSCLVVNNIWRSTGETLTARSPTGSGSCLSISLTSITVDFINRWQLPVVWKIYNK